MQRYVVATVSEIPPGTHKVFSVGGRPIGIFNLGGAVMETIDPCSRQARVGATRVAASRCVQPPAGKVHGLDAVEDDPMPLPRETGGQSPARLIGTEAPGQLA